MKLITAIFFLSTTALFAQHKCIVFFKDKAVKENKSFALSQMASERRAKIGVTYDNSDLPINPTYLQVIQQSDGSIIQTSKWLNAVLVESKQLINWSNLPFVSKVTLVEGRKNGRTTMEVSDQLQGNAQSSDKNFVMHDGAVLGWNGYTGRGVHIAVFDAGFYGVDSVTGFEKLRDENRIFYTRDMIKGGSVYQYDQHGTQTLSVMAGYRKDSFTGTAVDATYSLFVTENVASETLVEEFNWVAAAEIADSLGVDIISSSVGYTQFDDANTNYVFADLDGLTCISTIGAIMAARKGILVVNSAGNSRALPWMKIGAPADADSILTVGAVSSDLVVTNFSSPGPTADGRIKPEVCALGLRTAVIDSKGDLRESSGTSFSTPLIAGLCASLWQAVPHYSNIELRKLVIEVSHKFSNPDTNFGYGIPNFATALAKAKGYYFESELQIFPNPAIGELYIATGNIRGDVDFVLSNSLGQLVSQLRLSVEKNSKVNLSPMLVSEVVGGTYFLSIQHADGKEQRALIFQ